MKQAPFSTKASNRIYGWITSAAFRVGYTPASMRRNFEILSGCSDRRLTKKYPNTRFTKMSLDGVPAEYIQATPNPTRLILFLHGGGYFMGSIDCYRRNAMRIAYRSDARVVLVDYRLAPEHPYPAALEDAKKAYLALVALHGEESIVLMGDSAGGGLVLATLLALRDEQKPLPSAAVCLSPWTDLTRSGKSHKKNAKRDFWLGQSDITPWADWYLQANDPKMPYISPIFGDFKGLPPLLFLVGRDEVLLDDSVRVAEKAQEAGVKVDLIVASGMQHVYPFSLPWLPQSKEAMKVIGEFVKKA